MYYMIFTGTSVTNPTYSNTYGPMYEEIKVEPNPSYKSQESKAITAYAEIELKSEESDVAQQAVQDEAHHEYEDVVNDLHIKMTRNPSYSVP